MQKKSITLLVASCNTAAVASKKRMFMEWNKNFTLLIAEFYNLRVYFKFKSIQSNNFSFDK